MSRSKPNPVLPIDMGGVAAVLAAVALIFVLGVRPIRDLQRQQAARHDRLSGLVSQIDGLDAQILSLGGEIENASAQIANRKLTLMSPDDLNARIAVAIERASAHGLRVLAIKPGELTHGEHHGRTPIDIGLTGLLPDLVRYLHAMRTESADLVVQRIEVRASEAGGGVSANIRTDWLTSAE